MVRSFKALPSGMSGAALGEWASGKVTIALVKKIDEAILPFPLVPSPITSVVIPDIAGDSGDLADSVNKLDEVG